MKLKSIIEYNVTLHFSKTIKETKHIKLLRKVLNLQIDLRKTKIY